MHNLVNDKRGNQNSGIHDIVNTRKKWQCTLRVRGQNYTWKGHGNVCIEGGTIPGRDTAMSA